VKGYDFNKTKTDESPAENTGDVRGFMNASSQMTSIEKEETYELND